MCNQSVGLIAGMIEKRGIPTVGISLLREVSEKVRPPRTLVVPFPFGYPLGQPHHPELQRQVITRAVEMLAGQEGLPAFTNLSEQN